MGVSRCMERITLAYDTARQLVAQSARDGWATITAHGGLVVVHLSMRRHKGRARVKAWASGSVAKLRVRYAYSESELIEALVWAFLKALQRAKPVARPLAVALTRGFLKPPEEWLAMELEKQMRERLGRRDAAHCIEVARLRSEALPAKPAGFLGRLTGFLRRR